MECCARCGIWVDDEEWVVNFGVCESCFEEGCPCNEGRPNHCPLHLWPDIVLEYWAIEEGQNVS